MEGLTRYEGSVSPIAAYQPAGMAGMQISPLEMGIASFAWGDPAVTRLRRQADKTLPYAVGTNQPITLEHVGLLKKLRLITDLDITTAHDSGTVTQDAQGPWNIYQNILIRVSGLDLLYQVSGWGLYLINLVLDRMYAPDVNPSVVTDATNPGDLFNFPIPYGANQQVLFSLDLPFTVPLLGFNDLGLWLIQNETVNMEVFPTWAAAGGATPLNQPYVTAGDGTVVVNAGSAAVWRDFYGVPSRSEDMPPLGYVHQWEEQYDAVTGSQIDINHQRGGILLRLLYSIIDAESAPHGLANEDLAELAFKYDANDTPFDEDVFNTLARQRELYDRDLPQGVYTHDLFLDTRTLQDTYNTENYINIKTRFRFATSLTAGSYIRTIRERLLPVVVNTATS